jgi:hypothetical protein
VDNLPLTLKSLRRKVGASAPVSLGRAKDHGIWMPWKKPATTAAGTKFGSWLVGAGVILPQIQRVTGDGADGRFFDLVKVVFPAGWAFGLVRMYAARPNSSSSLGWTPKPLRVSMAY